MIDRTDTTGAHGAGWLTCLELETGTTSRRISAARTGSLGTKVAHHGGGGDQVASAAQRRQLVPVQSSKNCALSRASHINQSGCRAAPPVVPSSPSAVGPRAAGASTASTASLQPWMSPVARRASLFRGRPDLLVAGLVRADHARAAVLLVQGPSCLPLLAPSKLLFLQKGSGL